MAAILASLPAFKVNFLAFSTEVIDLTDRVDDPLGLLLEVSVGGGTHIARALRAARERVVVPSRTLLLLVSDFEEGGSVHDLIGQVRGLVESGVKALGLAALSDTGTPRYSVNVAEQLVAAGMPVAASAHAAGTGAVGRGAGAMSTVRPSISPGLLADLTAAAPARLVKKLDATPTLAESWTWTAGDSWTVVTDTNETVTLRPENGALSAPAHVACSCLLAPKCLHLLAVAAVLPVADSAAQEVPLVSETPAAAAAPVATVTLSASQLAAVALARRAAERLLAEGARAPGRCCAPTGCAHGPRRSRRVPAAAGLGVHAGRRGAQRPADAFARLSARCVDRGRGRGADSGARPLRGRSRAGLDRRRAGSTARSGT